jgi:hypothetical protein
MKQLSGFWDNFAKKNFSIYEFFGLKRAIEYVGIVGIAITKKWLAFLNSIAKCVHILKQYNFIGSRIFFF